MFDALSHARQKGTDIFFGQLGGALDHPSRLSELQLAALPTAGSLSDAAYTWAQPSGAALPLALTPDASGPSQGTGFASFTLRGEMTLPLAPTLAELQARRAVRPWDRCQRADELLQRILAEGGHAGLFHVATAKKPLPWAVPPMPQIWQRNNDTLAAAALWSSGERLRSTAEAMRDALAGANARAFLSPELEEDHVSSARETLASRCEF